MTEPTNTQAKALDLADLDGFTGSENFYQHGLNPNVLFSDGAKYVADKAGAYWLLDEIAVAQIVRRVAAEEFQVWKLKVRADRSAELSCDDGDDNVVFTKVIPFTDFPLEEIKLYFTNNVILLPREN